MIKSWKQFNEISGTELVGPVGPAYGDTKLQNKTVSHFNTDIIHSDIDDNMYMIDDYNSMYNDYLKKGGTPLQGFNKENLEKVIFLLQNSNESNTRLD